MNFTKTKRRKWSWTDHLPLALAPPYQLFQPESFLEEARERSHSKKDNQASEVNLKKPPKPAAKGKSLRVVKATKPPDTGKDKSNFMGTSDIELQLQLMFESTSLMGVTTEDVIAGKGLSAGKRVAAAIRGIDPQDELQGLLAVQLFASHNLAMTFCRRAVHPEQSSEGIDANVARASQFMKLFLEQASCLQKLKGKTGQQRVTVEHVHVNEGGQAIVGAVTSRGVGEG